MPNNTGKPVGGFKPVKPGMHTLPAGGKKPVEGVKNLPAFGNAAQKIKQKVGKAKSFFNEGRKPSLKNAAARKLGSY